MGRPARECGAFFMPLWEENMYVKKCEFFFVFLKIFI